MRKDDILMNKIIEEAGLLSRASARAKSLGGAIRQGLGDVGTAIAGKKPAPDSGWRGKYTSGKQEEILKTLSNDIVNDLRKLNIVPKGSPINTNEIKNMLTQYVSKYSGTGKQTTAPQQPPTSVPQASPTTPTVAPTAAPTTTSPSTTTATSTSTPTSTDTATVEPTEAESTPASPEPQTSTAPSWKDVWKKPVSSSESTPIEPEEEIPNESKIQDKKGTTYEYNSGDKKWYIASKAGRSTSQIPNDRPEVQDSISKAWRTKSQKEKETARELPTFESFKKFFWEK